MDNQPFLTEKFGDYTIDGYSRAAVQTYWRIDEMHLGFDLGGHPWDFMGVPNWFISHTHLDHIAALPSYIARRRMMKMTPPKVYVPAVAVGAVKEMLQTFVKLDKGRMHCEVIGVQEGDEIELSREMVVTVHKTKHTIPSFGYIVWERRKKLKPEYQNLSGQEIKEIRLGGTEVSQEYRINRLGYTGDTAPEGLDNNPEFYESEILISELTFVSPEHSPDKIHRNGHMHLNDYVDRRDRFQNKIVIAGHLSTRYHENQILRMIRKAIPDMLDGRLKIWV